MGWHEHDDRLFSGVLRLFRPGYAAHRIAVQLARESGADVTALVRDVQASRRLLSRLGARAVESLEGEFHVIVDAVGGPTFGRAIGHLAPRGVLINIATDTNEDTVTFNASAFDRAKGARIYTLNLFGELTAQSGASTDLARLCKLAGDGRLDGQVELEGSWRDPQSAVDAPVHRRVGGSVVLHMD